MASYWSVHHRMGRADTHLCPCGKPAKDWAYQHTGEVKYSPEGRAYSESPDDYQAMCVSCHQTLDREVTPDRFRNVKGRADIGSQMRERFLTDPEFAARRSAEMKVASNKQRRCLECGKVSTTYGLGSHLKKLGHVGYEDVS